MQAKKDAKIQAKLERKQEKEERKLNDEQAKVSVLMYIRTVAELLVNKH